MAANDVADPKYDRLWDDRGTRNAMIQMLQHYGSGGQGGGAGAGGTGAMIQAPGGLSDMLGQTMASFLLSNKSEADKKLIFEYIPKLRKMREMLASLQLQIQGGKVASARLGAAYNSMLASIPDPGTMNAEMVRGHWSTFKKTVDSTQRNFYGYSKEKFKYGYGTSEMEPSKEQSKPPLKMKKLDVVE